MTSSELKMNVMPPKQKVLFDYLAQQEWLKAFYLAGGTALALQIVPYQQYCVKFWQNINNSEQES